MAAFYSLIKNDKSISTELTCNKPSRTRGEKLREKKREKNAIAVSRSCRFHITSNTACRGIRFSSVLKSSACKFSIKKMNQTVVTLCKSI